MRSDVFVFFFGGVLPGDLKRCGSTAGPWLQLNLYSGAVPDAFASLSEALLAPVE